MKLLKGKRMEPAITQWAYESSTFVAFHGGLTRVLSALLGHLWGVMGGTWFVCLSTSSMKGGYCVGEGRLDTSGNLDPANDVTLLCLREKTWATRQGKLLDPRLKGVTSVLLL